MDEAKFEEDGTVTVPIDLIDQNPKVLSENILYLALYLSGKEKLTKEDSWAFDYINTAMHLLTGRHSFFNSKEDAANLVEGFYVVAAKQWEK